MLWTEWVEEGSIYLRQEEQRREASQKRLTQAQILTAMALFCSCSLNKKKSTSPDMWKGLLEGSAIVTCPGEGKNTSCLRVLVTFYSSWDTASLSVLQSSHTSIFWVLKPRKLASVVYLRGADLLPGMCLTHLPLAWCENPSKAPFPEKGSQSLWPKVMELNRFPMGRASGVQATPTPGGPREMGRNPSREPEAGPKPGLMLAMPFSSTLIQILV